VNFPPKIALSKLVNSLKGTSSRRMRQQFPGLRRHYRRANRLRSGSYFAGPVGGAPISVLRQYTEQQNRPGQGTPGPGGPPTSAFTTGPKAGALADGWVAVRSPPIWSPELAALVLGHAAPYPVLLAGAQRELTTGSLHRATSAHGEGFGYLPLGNAG
jgi:hypothetical protein